MLKIVGTCECAWENEDELFNVSEGWANDPDEYALKHKNWKIKAISTFNRKLDTIV